MITEKGQMNKNLLFKKNKMPKLFGERRKQISSPHFKES